MLSSASAAHQDEEQQSPSVGGEEQQESVKSKLGLHCLTATKLRFLAETLERMMRHRMHLGDPLQSVCAEYNRKMGCTEDDSWTMRDLVHRTEEVAATCVESYCKEQASRRYGLQSEALEKMLPMLRQSVKHSLNRFYMELNCLMQDLEDAISAEKVDDLHDLPLKNVLDLCYEVARDKVKGRLVVVVAAE